MDEQPIIIDENFGDKHEECIAENEHNSIVADNKLDIVILDKSVDENHEFNDENEHSITFIERVNTFDISGSLLGCERETFEQMYELYCLHAWEVGFSVRKNTQRHNCNGFVIEKNYVCSSEGVRNNTSIVPLSNKGKKYTRRRNITCTNCKASLRVKRGQDGLLEVIEHIEEHNHELSRKEWSHRHRSQRSITDDKVVRIEDMISSGMRASDSYRYMAKEAGGEHLVGHTMKDHLNFVNRMKMSAIDVGDAQSFIDMLGQDGSEDEDFFYRFKLNIEGRLSNVFWRDSMMCEDYHLYGDVVVFDTTYRINKYNMICAPFVGLNNHKKNVMFGCAFLMDEKIDTFEWLFGVFKKSMKLKCPITIFTDQDQAITNAISKVFPEARHRLCIWNLYQNAVTRLRRLKGNKAFNDAFQQCLTGCINKEQFEKFWASMISVYELQDNSWFARLYDLREKWCTAYNKDYFSAGIISSQRSESTNHAIGFKVSKATNLHEFYTIFKRTIQCWRSREQADEFECSRAIPNSRIPLTGMLKHASEVYTLSVFYDFEDELLKSISSTVTIVGEELGVKVYDVQDHDACISHRVNFFLGEKFVTCTCKRFEEYGLLCSHCLRILDRNSVQQIPTCYITKRWTKFAKKDMWDKIASLSDQIEELMDFNAWRHKMAINYYSILIKGQDSEEARMIIEEGSKSIFEAVEALATPQNLIEDIVVSTFITVLDPQRTTTKGRKKRIKGKLEKGRKKKTHNLANSAQLDEFGSKTPNPRLF